MLVTSRGAVLVIGHASEAVHINIPLSLVFWNIVLLHVCQYLMEIFSYYDKFVGGEELVVHFT